MRFYVKLFVAVVVFILAADPNARRNVREVAYDVRVAAVCQFGTADDFERLIDENRRALAEALGDVESYHRGKRYEQLLAERIRAATVHRHLPPTDEDLIVIREECARAVYGSTDRPADAG